MATRRKKRHTDPKVVVGYVRVSTDEQALGPEAQLQAIHSWCDAEGATLAAVHDDIGVSGGIVDEAVADLNVR